MRVQAVRDPLAERLVATIATIGTIASMTPPDPQAEPERTLVQPAHAARLATGEYGRADPHQAFRATGLTRTALTLKAGILA